MQVLNAVFGKIFEVIFVPFRGLDAWFGMIFISLVTGLLMLFVYSRTSNQAGIKAVKNRIKAHLLEIRLYKDSLPVQLKAQGRIVLANFRYIGYSAKPLLVMILPLLLILAQLNLWFGFRSLRPGEEVLLKIKLVEGRNPMDTAIMPDPTAGVNIETPALRLEEGRELDWRLRVSEKGLHILTFRLNNQTFTKTIAVDLDPLSRVSPLKTRGGILDEFFNPGEKTLPSGLPVKSVEIVYPGLRLRAFGIGFHWLIAYFLLSIIFGFALKRPFRVEI